MTTLSVADKNQGNLKEAEERFKEIQNAYEVLSDKHERAWYGPQSAHGNKQSLLCSSEAYNIPKHIPHRSN